MNWGNRIVVAFVCFAAFIGYMVVRAFQEDFDLVAEDYYAQEINYQSKLNSLATTAEAGKSVAINQDGSNVYLSFAGKSEVNGTIEFYHPSRQIFDKSFAINLQDRKQAIDKADLVAGSYRVNITWSEEGQDFYQQSKIYIN